MLVACAPHTLPFQVRRSLTTDTLNEQEDFVHHLVALPPGGGRFSITRYKSNMADELENGKPVDKKFTIINVAYTPVTESRKPVTFRHMMKADRARFNKVAKKRQDRDNIENDYMGAAAKLLGHNSIAKSPVTMVIEFQVTFFVVIQANPALRCVAGLTL